MMVKMMQWNWTMRSTSLQGRDRCLYLTNFLNPVLRSHASNPKPRAKQKKAAPITSLNVAIHESEINFQTGIQPCHKFEVSSIIFITTISRLFTKRNIFRLS